MFSANRIEAGMYKLLYQNTLKCIEEWVDWPNMKDNEDRL